MPLTNSQYDEIIRAYDARQLKNEHDREERTRYAYIKIPRLREIDDAIATCSVAQAKKLLDGDTMALNTLKEQIASYRSEKKDLLKKAGFSADYLETSYKCPDCKDTGYIDRKKCHCFRQKEIQLLYSSSRMEKVLQKENFSSLSYDVYDEEQQKAMPSIIRTCQNFADTFTRDGRSMLFYGSVGTGKTFLSNCIAGQLLDQGYSVVYFTSFQLFELLSGTIGNSSEQFRKAYEPLLESDLLILDDMGTEVSNTFTVSKLFQILNERALSGRSTIISTNLSLQQFRDVYSERIFSRITSSFTLLKFAGSDIRIRRKLSGSR